MLMKESPRPVQFMGITSEEQRWAACLRGRALHRELVWRSRGRWWRQGRNSTREGSSAGSVEGAGQLYSVPSYQRGENTFSCKQLMVD